MWALRNSGGYPQCTLSWLPYLSKRLWRETSPQRPSNTPLLWTRSIWIAWSALIWASYYILRLTGNTFKAGSFSTIAQAISAKFGVECYPSFVENQFHTLRTMWSTIQTLRKNSGFGWDDNLKMITCDAKTYQEEVMVWLPTIFC